jgi:hypothetical protein
MRDPLQRLLLGGRSLHIELVTQKRDQRLTRLILLALCGLTALAQPAAAQRTRVEADHVFVFVPPGGHTEAEALRKLGFVVDTAVTKHPGQGTASRAALFHNAYFELIWIDSTVSVTDANREMFSIMKRSADWRASGASPFGLGLRRLEEGDDFGVPATPYSAAWMKPGSAIQLLKPASEPDAADIFVVPSYMALPAWIEKVKQHAPALLLHPNRSRQLTFIEIRGPAPQIRYATSLRMPSVQVTESAEPLLVLEFDAGTEGKTLDMRPLLPIVIRK